MKVDSQKFVEIGGMVSFCVVTELFLSMDKMWSVLAYMQIVHLIHHTSLMERH